MKTKRLCQFVVSVIFALFSLGFLIGTVMAQFPQAQAFATHGVNSVDGMEADVWTAQQPAAQNNFRASPVGLCTTPPPTCQGPFVETGYNKGDNSPNPNMLQQYASYLTQGGAIGGTFGLGNLADNTWYTFHVHNRINTTKWKIERNGVNVWTTPAIGFDEGSLVVCGAEAFQNGTNMAVECRSMRRRVFGVWAFFDYTSTQTKPGYCVFKPQQFGAIGWGLC